METSVDVLDPEIEKLWFGHQQQQGTTETDLWIPVKDLGEFLEILQEERTM